jgi:hypothetical protein
MNVKAINRFRVDMSPLLTVGNECRISFSDSYRLRERNAHNNVHGTSASPECPQP